MGNDQSTKKELLAREADTRALNESLLERQRRFYEQKCQILLQQAQTSNPAVVVEQVHVGNSSSQPTNMLYPDLNVAATYQPNSTNMNNMPATYDTVNNCIPSRNIVSTPINNNFIPKKEVVRTRITASARPKPSAPPEPSATPESSAPIQLQKNKGQRPRNNRSIGKEYNCETCGATLGLNIFQCTNGHSSCRDCKMSKRTCGKYKCGSIITDMRNRTVEVLIAEMKLSDHVEREPTIPKYEQKVSCPNQHIGCKLHFTKKDMANHTKECPFNDIPCPLASIFGRCHWLGKINQLAEHFNNSHPEHKQANVDTEMAILDIKIPCRIVHLVAVGKFIFLLNIKIDTAAQTIFMAVQFFGTGFSASKWTYEFHVYNKSTPRRKYQYSDVCLSNSVSADEMFCNNTCAVIPASYFKTFENNGLLNYKFYIRKPEE